MIVYLDTTAIAQIMICQPIIACPLWGVMVGRPEIGLFFGVVFQLIWLGNLQIGAAKFAEGNIGAFVATVLASAVPPQPNGEPAWIVIALALALGVIVAQIGSELAPLVRRVVGKITPSYVAAATHGKASSVRNFFLLAVAIHLLAGFLFSLISLAAGHGLFNYVLGDFYLAGTSESTAAAAGEFLTGLWPALLGAGAAAAVLILVRRATRVTFLVSSVIFLSAGLLWIN
jgi:mannose/fructose/N-acetylgalactosamine-specific phosphotransferase system component IIC